MPARSEVLCNCVRDLQITEIRRPKSISGALNPNRFNRRFEEAQTTPAFTHSMNDVVIRHMIDIDNKKKRRTENTYYDPYSISRLSSKHATKCVEF